MTKPYNVDSSFPCENTARRIDGAYICNLHYYSSAKPQRMSIPMGPTNPLDWTLPRLARQLHERSSQYQTLKHTKGTRVEIENFLALSIVRLCVRPGHDGPVEPDIVDTPRTERLISYVFTPRKPEFIDIERPRLAQLARVSDNGLGSARQKGVLPPRAIEPLIHLPVSNEELAVPVSMDRAVDTQRPLGRAAMMYVALHEIPQPDPELDPVYIEQLVPFNKLYTEA